MQAISVLSPGITAGAGIVVTGVPGLVIEREGSLALCHTTLAGEMRRLACNNVVLLVGLVEDEELGCVAYEDIADAAELACIRSIRFPLRDFAVPAPAEQGDWQALISETAGLLRGGHSVALHCMAGDGRSGLLAACLLVELGLTPREALKEVRTVRPQALETAAQIDYLFSQQACGTNRPQRPGSPFPKAGVGP